jgi:hypothetical protein
MGKKSGAALDVAHRGDWKGLFVAEATFGDPHTGGMFDRELKFFRLDISTKRRGEPMSGRGRHRSEEILDEWFRDPARW